MLEHSPLAPSDSLKRPDADQDGVPDLDSLLERIGQSLQQSVPFISGGILFHDSITKLIYPRLYRSTSANVRSPRLFRWSEGHFKTIAETRQPLLIDTISGQNYLPADPTTCSAIVAPILDGANVIGVVFAESSQAHAYTDLHLSLLTAYADQIALSAVMSERYIDLNNRYKRLSTYNDQMLLRNEISRLITDDLLSETLWPRLADYLARFSRASECAITLWDDSTEQVQLLGRYSSAALQPVSDVVPTPELSFEWSKLTRKMAFSPTPLILNQAQVGEPDSRLFTENVQAFLGMPLIARQKYVGAVMMVNTDAPRSFSSLDVTQLTSVLDKIGLTIDNNVLFRGLQSQLSEASALLEVGRIATSTPDIEPMLRQVIEFVCRSLQVEVGLLLLYDTKTRTLHVRADQTTRSELRDTLQQITISVTDPVSRTAQTFRSGQGYFANNVVTDEQNRAYALYRRLKLTSVLEVPIRNLNRFIGVVLVGNKKSDFAHSDLDFLSAVCNYLSSALYNADLLNETRAQLIAADTMRSIANITGSGRDVDDILHEVTEKVARLIGVPGVVVYLYDQASDWLFANDKSRYGTAMDMSLPVVATQSASLIAVTYRRREISWQPRLDMPDGGLHATTVVTCPLHIHNRTLGVLVMLGLDLDTLYDDDSQIESMHAVAAQIAVSIENTQLFTAERQRANLMALIIEIGQTLASQLDIRSLTRSVVKSVHDLLNYDAVYLYTLDETDRQIALASAATSHAEMQIADDSKFAFGTGIVGRAFATGAIQSLINSPGSSEVYWPSSKYRIFSELVFPLRNRDKVIGAIEIVSNRPTGFQDMERTALDTLASQISTAMENAHLWDEARNRLIEEQIVSQVGNVLVSILDYKQLGEAIVQHMARAMDTSSCLLISYLAETDEAIIEAEYRPPDIEMQSAHRISLPAGTIEGQVIRKAIHSRRLALYPETGALDLSGSTASALDLPIGTIPISSAIALPLIARDRTIGCMLWIETRADRRIMSSDVRLAQTLTTQAAIAVENARLFAELEERAFELAKANSLKSEFLARVSHELRTPLNSIIGYSDMLLNSLYGSLTDKQADRIERVRRNGMNLLRLIDDLLDISKIDSGKLELQIETLSLADNLRSVVETLDGQIAARGLVLKIDLPPDLPLVIGDALRLRQIFTNLIGNALKFTIQGSVTIEAEIVIAQAQPMIAVRVIDTGIGIAPDDQKIVFDEFRQVGGTSAARIAGTGLGLSIVRRFVELMGGQVWVESEVGKGSTFTFTLPTASERDRLPLLQ